MGGTNSYRRVVRPLAFRLRPEVAHDLGKTLYRRRALWELAGTRFRIDDPRLEVDLAGLRLSNPVGLAAGFDKNAEMIATMRRLGFGYVIPGSIRAAPAGDVPRPNIVRYVDRRSLVNCTGLPSRGAAYSAERLAALPADVRRDIRIIPSVQGLTIEEYLAALRVVQPWSDAIELPLFCPNETYVGVDFLDPRTARTLLIELNAIKERPFLVKIRNYHDERERSNRLELVRICVELGVDGITLPGSMTVPEPRLSRGRGNLSGRAVLGNTLRNIADVFDVTEGRMPIKALGGISTARDAFDAIAAGATTVELLTGLVYEGWAVAARINRGLLRLLEREGVASVPELRGARSAAGRPAEPVAAAAPA